MRLPKPFRLDVTTACTFVRNGCSEYLRLSLCEEDGRDHRPRADLQLMRQIGERAEELYVERYLDTWSADVAVLREGPFDPSRPGVYRQVKLQCTVPLSSGWQLELHGRADLVHVLPGGNEVRVIEVKTSEIDALHLLQLGIYSDLLRRACGEGVRLSCEVVQVDPEGRLLAQHTCEPDAGYGLGDLVARLEPELRAISEQPLPSLHRRCEGCTYLLTCYERAWEQQDVSLLGLPPDEVRALRGLGCLTLEDVLTLGDDRLREGCRSLPPEAVRQRARALLGREAARWLSSCRYNPIPSQDCTDVRRIYAFCQPHYRSRGCTVALACDDQAPQCYDVSDTAGATALASALEALVSGDDRWYVFLPDVEHHELLLQALARAADQPGVAALHDRLAKTARDVPSVALLIPIACSKLNLSCPIYNIFQVARLEGYWWPRAVYKPLSDLVQGARPTYRSVVPVDVFDRLSRDGPPRREAAGSHALCATANGVHADEDALMEGSRCRSEVSLEQVLEAAIYALREIERVLRPPGRRSRR